MNKLRTILKLVAVMAIASVLFSCAPKAVNLETLDPNTYDQSWLTGKPCAAPCWYGLEPGVSTRQDSINRVEQLPLVDSSSINITNHLDFGFVDISFSYKRSQESGALEMIWVRFI